MVFMISFFFKPPINSPNSEYLAQNIYTIHKHIQIFQRDINEDDFF
jgi:hypothetical protein